MRSGWCTIKIGRAGNDKRTATRQHCPADSQHAAGKSAYWNANSRRITATRRMRRSGSRWRYSLRWIRRGSRGRLHSWNRKGRRWSEQEAWRVDGPCDRRKSCGGRDGTLREVDTVVILTSEGASFSFLFTYHRKML